MVSGEKLAKIANWQHPERPSIAWDVEGCGFDKIAHFDRLSVLMRNKIFTSRGAKNGT